MRYILDGVTYALYNIGMDLWKTTNGMQTDEILEAFEPLKAILVEQGKAQACADLMAIFLDAGNADAAIAVRDYRLGLHICDWCDGRGEYATPKMEGGFSWASCPDCNGRGRK